MCTKLDLSQSHIEVIEYGAFLWASLTSVIFSPYITTLNDNAFGLCPLTSINIVSTIRFMTGFSFNQCPFLDTLTVDPQNPYFYSENNFIFSKNGSILVRTPINFEEEDIPNKENIQVLGRCLSSGSTYKQFIGWENLSRIDGYTFHASPNLKLVDISMTHITSIPDHAFQTCPILTDIRLPGNLTSLQDHAFTSNIQLRSIFIPIKVSEINNLAFVDLHNLRLITYYGETSFESPDIISDCPQLKTVRVIFSYPSDKFGNINVVRNAYMLGNTEICPSINHKYCLFNNFNSLFLFTVFISM